MNHFTISAISFLFLTFGAYAQTDTPSENPIQDKFSELIENSNSYKNYKVIDYNQLTEVQNSTVDFIEGLKQEISTAENTILSQEETIAGLKTELSNTQASLEEVNAKKDSMLFLGIPFSKSAYNMMMWGIVGALVIVLAFLFIRFKSSHSLTKDAQKRLDETEKEFEAFRLKSLEKEQRLGRLLQDEKNKLMKIAK